MEVLNHKIVISFDWNVGFQFPVFSGLECSRDTQFDVCLNLFYFIVC